MSPFESLQTTEILVDVNDSVGTITLNRPDALNAITPTMLSELNAAVAALSDDADGHCADRSGTGLQRWGSI